MATSLFPLTILVGDQIFTQARFYGTPEKSQVWIIGGSGQPELAAEGPGFVKMARAMGDRFPDGTRVKHLLNLADETVWMCTPSGGCGCGHPLKRFNPAKADA